MRGLLLIFIVLLASCSSDRKEDDRQTTAESEPGIAFRRDGRLSFLRADQEIVAIDIEIADTDSSRARGLMQRKSLPEKSGMLFLFPRQEPQSFWMANTPLALDIFFVDADSQVVSIAKYTKPFSPQSVESAGPAQYVVETPAGFADTYGIVEGNRVQWSRTDT